MKIFSESLSLILAMLIFANYSSAYSLTVNYEAGTTQTITALTGYSTYGADMDGMTITATFSDGTFEIVPFSLTGFNSGGAYGKGWALAQSGNTFSNSWTLFWYEESNQSIREILIDAGTGNAVFDVIDSDESGINTPDSARGWPFDVKMASNQLDIAATYMDIVTLKGKDTAGDLYRQLRIQFTNADGFYDDYYLYFITDTDSLLLANDIYPSNPAPLPETSPVPEPASMLLLGSGLIGLASFKRKFIYG